MTTTVLLPVSSTSSPNQPRPEVSEGAQANQTTIEISSFSEQVLSQAQESGDVLSALYLLTATSQHDGDSTVVTNLPDA